MVATSYQILTNIIMFSANSRWPTNGKGGEPWNANQQTSFAASNFGILTAAIFPLTGDLSHSYTRGIKKEYNSR